MIRFDIKSLVKISEGRANCNHLQQDTPNCNNVVI